MSVGVDHDTASFAVETIRRWWYAVGQPKYPRADRLLITVDSGGSNGSRLRLWKFELQGLADETGLRLAVCHFPPGTSKWNKIEHRLFSFISQNWRGQPLTSLAVIVSLIAGTTTTQGLQGADSEDTGPADSEAQEPLDGRLLDPGPGPTAAAVARNSSRPTGSFRCGRHELSRRPARGTSYFAQSGELSTLR